MGTLSSALLALVRAALMPRATLIVVLDSPKSAGFIITANGGLLSYSLFASDHVLVNEDIDVPRAVVRVLFDVCSHLASVLCHLAVRSKLRRHLWCAVHQEQTGLAGRTG